ncbi:MAG: ABC transporter ATP-binding protein [Polyangiaceae bacterium]|jgi:ABC-2 type transport system ATP-binding protein
MVSIQHLVKRYGARLAVDDLSFEVPRGEVVGFLGPNGAGKSTTLRILSGFLGMTSGKVSVDGHDVATDSYAARKCIGYMPEAVPLYPEMRVAEYLTFRAELKGVARKGRRGNVDGAMEQANVTDVASVPIGKLSKGYRQRVGLADALVAKPPLLVLDEPTAGLDPNQIVEVRDVIKALGREHTVLISTHILSEVEASCSRVVVIDRGKLVAEGATRDIRRMRRAPAADVTVRGDIEELVRILNAVDGVVKVKRIEIVAGEPDVGVYRCTWVKTLADAQVVRATEQIVTHLVAHGYAVREVRPSGGTLEDVFRDLTRAARDDESDAPPSAPPSSKSGAAA